MQHCCHRLGSFNIYTYIGWPVGFISEAACLWSFPPSKVKLAVIWWITFCNNLDSHLDLIPVLDEAQQFSGLRAMGGSPVILVAQNICKFRVIKTIRLLTLALFPICASFWIPFILVRIGNMQLNLMIYTYNAWLVRLLNTLLTLLLFSLLTVYFTLVHWNVDCYISSWILDKFNEGNPSYACLFIYFLFKLENHNALICFLQTDYQYAVSSLFRKIEKKEFWMLAFLLLTELQTTSEAK